MSELTNLVFHEIDQGFAVSVDGEMATEEFIDRLVTILNNDQEVQAFIKDRLKEWYN